MRQYVMENRIAIMEEKQDAAPGSHPWAIRGMSGYDLRAGLRSFSMVSKCFLMKLTSF